MENIAERNVIRVERRGAMREPAKQLLTIAAGTIVGFLIATVLHFVWQWTGGMRAAAIFGSVNESVWEHFKILAWAYLFWSVAEYFILRPDIRQYLAARALGLLAILTLTVCFYYVYSGILGKSVAWVDIASGALWLLCGELISIRVINSPVKVGDYGILFAAVILLIIVMLLCFSASPPRIGLFRDPATGLYGLETRP